MGIARLAGHRNITRKTATEIIGNNDNIASKPLGIIVPFFMSLQEIFCVDFPVFVIPAHAHYCPG
jgi:hypothetical protein